MRFGMLGLGLFLVVTAACSALRTGAANTAPSGDDEEAGNDPSTTSSEETPTGRSNGSSSSGDRLSDAGVGIDPDSGSPIPSDGGTLNVKIQSITVGRSVACVVYVNGEMRCWGDYRLAGGGSSSTPKPSPIPIRASDGAGFLVGVAEVSASYWHACARLFNGNFACWGFNNEYQLGDFTRDVNASTTVTPFARLVKDASTKGPLLRGVQNFAGIGRVSGGVAHSAAITDLDGAVLTWGYVSGTDNWVLGRGDDPSQADAITPKPVHAAVIGTSPPPADDRLLGAKNVDLARYHGCAALATNKVACWGDNSSGKLGVGNGVSITDGRPRFVSVPDGVGLLKVSVGDTSACALTAMNRVRCWGQNNQGQSGTTGSSQHDASVDVLIEDGTPNGKPLADVVDVAVGNSFACALVAPSAGGKVYCWGTSDAFVLGDGTPPGQSRFKGSPVASELVPVKKDLTGARLLAVGDSTACVVLGDHEARCWGQGPLGKRGDATFTSSIPRVVDDL